MTLNQIPELFQRLCGKNLESVVFATTKSNKLPTDVFIKRNDELQKKYLKRWMEQGATVSNLLSDSPASAQALVNVVLQGVEKH